MGTGPAPERTEDGRWIVVGGRRWRAGDPAIPDRLRQELVDELMDARRAVGAARRSHDDEAERAARARVQQAKVALGERGEPWWDEPSDAGRHQRLTAVVSALTHHRGPDRSICPSDAARAIGGEDWRDLMEPAREAARQLARTGQVVITQKGAGLDPDQPWRGPIRIRSVGPQADRA